jgi:hypothetical protein
MMIILPEVHLFWDNRAIAREGSLGEIQREGWGCEPGLRIHYRNLLRLAAAGRAVASCVSGNARFLAAHLPRVAAEAAAPQVAVVLTGDGEGFEGARGYRDPLERMHARGWGIEVVSWGHACSGALRRWARSAGVFVPLEEFYDAVTFVEGFREAEPLLLTGRRAVVPRGWSPPPPAVLTHSMGLYAGGNPIADIRRLLLEQGRDPAVRVS